MLIPRRSPLTRECRNPTIAQVMSTLMSAFRQQQTVGGATNEQVSERIQIISFYVHSFFSFFPDDDLMIILAKSIYAARDDNLASNINLRRSPRLMEQAQSQESQHAQKFKSEEGEVVHFEVLQEDPHSRIV
ncbi:hypothetical protein MKW98_016742 [Papaver atlanticum]|uniref:Uncharacterized protein n=1 Tax=Papaver atlanticum TaxID=357466 RepID=A0AAD4TJP7_9MAGN|nr:hypothetical protein MKW98_016742 [Papaver atlanticum]